MIAVLTYIDRTALFVICIYSTLFIIIFFACVCCSICVEAAILLTYQYVRINKFIYNNTINRNIKIHTASRYHYAPNSPNCKVGAA